MSQTKPLLSKVASLPEERKLWWIRKLYCLPPTDPRFLNLTSEQIDLEWEHFLIDNPKIKESMEDFYKDPNYENWEQETIEELQKTYKEVDDWEEVELDLEKVVSE